MLCQNKYETTEVKASLENLPVSQQSLVNKGLSKNIKASCKKELCILSYILKRPPSQLSCTDVINIESYLNELANQAENWKWPDLDSIDTAVGFATTLVTVDANTDEFTRHRHPDFGKYAKKLGRVLNLIGSS